MTSLSADLFPLRIGEYRVVHAVVAGIVCVTDIFQKGGGTRSSPEGPQATSQTRVPK